MATRKSQRVGIWIIAIAMVLGTIASFAALILAPNTQEAQRAQQEADFARQMKQFQEQQREARAENARISEPLEGYSAASFDAANISELRVETLVEGNGKALSADSTILANYFGWTADGKIFDSSRKKGETNAVEFNLSGGVIPGWTEGLTGVKVGSVVRLSIPAEKAYGTEDKGTGDPTGPLQFIIEVKELKASE